MSMNLDRLDEHIDHVLDEVRACGDEFAMGWLRSAYHSHERGIAIMHQRRQELIALFLARVTGPLTVHEAQLCSVCRICHGKITAPFKLDHGKEFAHEACLVRQIP